MGKILLIEDDEISQRIARAALEEHTVVIAKDYDSSIEALDNDTYDLILLDLILPGEKSGLEVLNYIRGNKRLKHLHVVITSIRNSDGAREIGYDLGADGYLPKPFAKGVLRAAVEARLRRGKHDTFKQVIHEIEFDMSRLVAYLLKENDRTKLDLKPREVTILYRLLLSENAVVTSDDLRIALNSKTSDEKIWQYISQLRQKISNIFEISMVKKGQYVISHLLPDSFSA